jgi:6-phosphogluconate dehydrogenase
MKLGMVGLGRMGGNMTERLRRRGHTVETYARTAPERTTSSLEELTEKLDPPRVIWLMIPAGTPTEHAVETLLPLLADGDVLVDGGNSNFRDSMRRAEECAAKGFRFVDVGTSGGIWGLDLGYCMMVGGQKDAIDVMRPLLDTLAPPDGWAHFGKAGAGHFVKMVHNGIEYGMMQAYGEGFELLHASEFGLDLQQVAKVWNNGSVVRSWLLELAERAFEQEGADLKGIKGYVADSGEGRWTILEAIAHDVPATVLAHSLFARFTSRQDDSYAMRLAAALRNQFGGHALKTEDQSTAVPDEKSSKAGHAVKKE